MEPLFKKIAVTGASGFLGQAFVSFLSRRFPTLQINALCTRNAPAEFTHVRNFKGRLNPFELSPEFLSGVQAVFHFAFKGFPSENPALPEEEVLANLNATSFLLKQMKEFGVKKIISAGSGGAIYTHENSSPQTELTPTLTNTAYAAGKLGVEHLLEMSQCAGELTAYNFRISNVYGPGQALRHQSGIIAKAFHCLTNGQTLPLWIDPETQKDFIYIEDVLLAFETLLTQNTIPGGIYNLGGGRSHSILKVLQTVEEVTGQKLSLSRLESKPALMAHTCLNIDKFKSHTGWAPKTQLKEGIRTFWGWYTGTKPSKKAA